MMRFHPRVVSEVLLVAALITACLILFGYHGTLNYGKVRVRVPPQNSTNKEKGRDLHFGIVGDFNNDAKVNSSAEVKLIILTYMRSGSSFTGDLFNHHPEVFYVFEPLWSIEKNYVMEQPVFFFNKSYEKPKQSDFYDPASLSVETIKSFLDCRLRDLNLRTLTQYHHINSRTTIKFFHCQKPHQGILGLLFCLPSFEETCNAARVTSVKTIRLHMDQAAALIKRDPKVKVIHLLRDPRGTLRSQASVAEFRWNAVANASRTFCQRVQKDLEEAQKLKTLYPGRVLSARYEDVAMDPLKFAEKLLKFAGLSLNKSLQEYVWKITSAGLKDGGATSTQRNDSRKTALSWRSKVSFQDVTAIDGNCKEVYRRVGYLPLTLEASVKNLSIPSYLDHTRIPELWT